MLQSSLRKLNTGYFLSHYRVILKPSGSWQIPNCFQTEMCHRATSNTLPVACMWPFQIAHMREWYGAHCLQYHDPTCWSFVPDSDCSGASVFVWFLWVVWWVIHCLIAARKKTKGESRMSEQLKKKEELEKRLKVCKKRCWPSWLSSDLLVSRMWVGSWDSPQCRQRKHKVFYCVLLYSVSIRLKLAI